MKYILVHFPEVQNYMEEGWFDEEAYICIEITGSYFIPQQYITIEYYEI